MIGSMFLVIAAISTMILFIEVLGSKLAIDVVADVLVVGFLVGGMLVSTSSTMFANPQVTIAIIFTYSAAGIQPTDAIIFIILQFFAAVIAFFIWKYVISNCACPINYTK